MNTFVLVVYTAFSVSLGVGTAPIVGEKEDTYPFKDLEQCTTALKALTKHSDARAECMTKFKYMTKEGK